MPTTIAIFSDMKSMQDAQDALRANGLSDAVQHVVDQSADGAEGTAPVIAGSQKQGAIAGRGDPTRSPDRAHDLEGMDLPEGEAAFIEDAVADGARVLVLDSDDPARVEDLLRPHAQRLVPPH